MNKRWLISGLTCLSIVIFGPFAAAELIVDTGEPTTVMGLALNYYQWPAAEFTVPAPGYTVTDIEGYFFSGGDGDISVYITADGGDNPSPLATALYSGSFYLNADDDYDWFGVHGENLFLAGNADYWVVFGASIPMGAAMPLSTPSPLGHYAVSLNQGASWTSLVSFHDFGVRISAAPVPEPATVLLIGIGLVGLVGFGKKFKK